MDKSRSLDVERLPRMLRPFRSKLAACKDVFKVGQEISIREHVAIPGFIPSSSPLAKSPTRQLTSNSNETRFDAETLDFWVLEAGADYSQPARKKRRRLPTSEERLVRSLLSMYYDIFKKSQSVSTFVPHINNRQPTSLAVTCARAIGRTIGETTPLNAPEETESLYDHIPANYTGHVLMAHVTHLIITNLHQKFLWLQLARSCLQIAPMEAFDFACAVVCIGNQFNADECEQAMDFAYKLQRPLSHLDEFTNALTLAKVLQPAFYDYLPQLASDLPLIPLYSKAIICLTQDSEELNTPKPKRKRNTAFIFDTESSPPPVSTVRSNLSIVVSRRLKILVRLLVQRYFWAQEDEEAKDKEEMLLNVAEHLWYRTQVTGNISHLLPSALCIHTLLLIAPARKATPRSEQENVVIQRLATLSKLCKKFLPVKAISKGTLRRRKNKQDGHYNQAHVRMILSVYKKTSRVYVVVQALRKAGIYDLACQVSKVVIAHWDQLVDAETKWSSVAYEDVVLIDDFDRQAFECEDLAAAEKQSRGLPDWKYEDSADAWVRMSSPSHSSPSNALRWQWGHVGPAGPLERSKASRLSANTKKFMSCDSFDAWSEDEQSDKDESQPTADPKLDLQDDVPDGVERRVSYPKKRQRRSYFESEVTSCEVNHRDEAPEYHSDLEDDNSDEEGSISTERDDHDNDLVSDSFSVPLTNPELEDSDDLNTDPGHDDPDVLITDLELDDW